MAVTEKLKKPQTPTMVDGGATQKTPTAVAQRLKKIKQSLSKAVACFHPSVKPVPIDSDDVHAENEGVPVALEVGGHGPEKEINDAPAEAPKSFGDSPRKEFNDVAALALKIGCDSPGKEIDDFPALALKIGGDSPRKEVDDVPEIDGDDTASSSPGRGPDATPRALRMDTASFYVPHHDEDAHFSLPDAGVVGVADGVGGYRKKGVDAGAFARALMHNASAAAAQAATKRDPPLSPYSLLLSAYDAAAQLRAPGASTAVILSLDGATLRWAYVGDSGFAVLRGGEIIHRSTPQRHRYNCPYQLRAGEGCDSVFAAEVNDMPVRDGDVVVVGTDGLFDNVDGDVLEWLVRRGTEMGWSPWYMAAVIAGMARKIARKVDDITVIVTFIASDMSASLF